MVDSLGTVGNMARLQAVSYQVGRITDRSEGIFLLCCDVAFNNTSGTAWFVASSHVI